MLYNGGVLKNSSKITDTLKKQSSGGVLSKDVIKILKNSQKNTFAGISFVIKLQAGNLRLSEATTGDIQ